MGTLFSYWVKQIGKILLPVVGVLISVTEGKAQCNTLRPQVDINFNTDQDCAPVTVTQFTITFYFSVPQDPNDIQILYEWFDPLNSTTYVDIGSGLTPGATAFGINTSFTANATFTYTDNGGQCAIIPTASIIVLPDLCTTSANQLTAFFWGTDEQGNAAPDISMTPADWEVCYNNPVIDAVFFDASDFNCNIGVEPDNPNRSTRHVQFVYGTNHNPAATILNLTLDDGATQGLTDGGGNLVSTSTRGTAGQLVTGAYFGPIDAIPFPADGPVSFTYPMSAPADAANLIGNRFEVTMFNWNACNPWNGSTANPNYEDAVSTTGYIVIVEAPAPLFETKDSNGDVTKDFCIGEDILFDNDTPGPGGAPQPSNAYDYTWEFYDDAAGTILLATRNQTNPTFSFASGGTKLIRLIASNPTAQGSCVEEYTDIVNITPALVANILVTDFSNNAITPLFCQEANAPLTDFEVRFTDNSSGTSTANTRWRWEFYDENNVLVSDPAGAGNFSTTQLGPYDRFFTNPGVYRVKLIIRDDVTLCETEDEVQVIILNEPVPAFNFDRVCAGTATQFSDNSTLTSINGQQIVLWEWDMSYDGITFTADAGLTNQLTFSYLFPAAGSYDVALRVTTDQNACSDLIVQTVTVDPIPASTFNASVLSGCSVLSVTLTNTSVAGQPDVIDRFVWEIDEGSGYQIDSIQRPTDPGFTGVYTRDFENFGTVNKPFNVRLRTITQNNCEQVSAPQTITVFPGPKSGFIATNYNPFNDNCSPQTVDFTVDNQTQAMGPSDYTWEVTDASGILITQSTGTTPAFSYQFVNATQSIRDYQITLTTTLPTTCNRDSTKTIRINPVPVASFVRDTILFDCQVMNMQFDADQKGLNEYAWTVIVNGATIFTQTSASDRLNYNFNRVGVVQNVEVRLQTTNFANCQSSEINQMFSVPVNDNITVDFTATPLNQTLPNSTVTITNNTTAGPWQYDWDFGDGNTFSGSNPGTHTYGTYGTFPITLTVTNNICVQSQTISVTIDPILPILDFDFDPPSGCAPHTVNFTNLSQFADPATYRWEFGTNEGTSQAVNPTYTYAAPGIYSVTLYATNIMGVEVSVTKSGIIEVFESPVAQFNIQPTLVYVPGGKVYTNNRSTGAGSYEWFFGDGQTSTEFEPIISYTTEGIYDIMLVATNSSGCTDTAKLESVVRAEKAAEILLPNAFTPGKDGPGSGDNQNDVFLPIAYGVTEFQMMIFNRWGQLLFESKSLTEGWDGYYEGKLCKQDVYVYKITAKYQNGDVITRVGDIHLMR